MGIPAFIVIDPLLVDLEAILVAAIRTRNIVAKFTPSIRGGQTFVPVTIVTYAIFASVLFLLYNMVGIFLLLFLPLVVEEVV